MKKYFFFTVCAFILAWGGFVIRQQFTAKDNHKPAVKITKQVRYGFHIRNKTNSPIHDGQLWVYAPVVKTGAQTCSSITVNLPHKIIEYANGNRILMIEVNDLPPYGHQQIAIQADLNFTAAAAQPVRMESLNAYLRPEPCIESDHPDIVNTAENLKKQNESDTVKAVFEWVSSHIESSGYIQHNRGALYALRYKKGDCTEFMSLFVALCRALSIPARGIGGYTCAGNCILQPSSYHNWAQVHVDGAWRLADCQKRVYNKDHHTYIAMQVISGDTNTPMKQFRQFSFKGKGLSVTMKH